MSDETLHLRPATLDDCQLLFDWASDPVTRQNSFSSAPIEWDAHVRWLQEAIANPDKAIYIVADASGHLVGQVRFEMVAHGDVVVSISIDPGRRGQGLASDALRLTMTTARLELGFNTANAYVKEANPASIQTFVRVGYRRMGAVRYRDHEAIHLKIENTDPATS